MLDTFNIPDNSLNNQIFYSTTSGSTSWQIWQKPNNTSFVYIYVIGGGAGGGGGGTGGGVARGGGGGGGSSAFSVGLFPATLLPDTLYIQVGNGGNGGSAGTAGSIGGLSYVSISASTSTNPILMKSGTASPTAGGGSTTTAGGTAGVGSTIWDYTLHVFPQLGQITTYAGSNGVAGGGSAQVGNSVTISNIVTGGAGGGGANTVTYFGGGDITGTGFINTIPGGVLSGASGSGGYMTNIPSTNSSVRQPMLFTGGAGGAGTLIGTAGFGGNGAYGSGGAGGGASVNGTGGSGGRGGDGIVLITSW